MSKVDISEKIHENQHLRENISSSSIRDIHVNNRVRRSLPQITLMHTDVGARRMLITDLSDYFLNILRAQLQ